MRIQAQSKLLFIGDSITSGARNFALGGEGRTDDAYGSGYVVLVRAFLDAFYPERRIRVVNKGVGGHTVRDLAGRWGQDVIGQKPDWLSVMIGINDVWRQFDTPQMPECHVLPDEYESTYRRILREAKDRLQLSGLVIVSPYVLDAYLQDPMRQRMDEVRAISRMLADEFAAIYVDAQDAFDAYMAHQHPTQLCWDRIHPSLSGHMVIARAWLNAIGFSWNPSFPSSSPAPL